jgi:hypothetical protein
VLPYPIAPSLAERLSPTGLALRHRQLSPTDSAPIDVCIPVSGAAVGLSYSRELIHGLATEVPRARVHVVSRDSGHTRSFLREVGALPFLSLHAFYEDRAVVRAYTALYRSEVLAFEVTKPSEQSFKALCHPDQRGGVVLLLSEPVGMQEHDNLEFLRRHGLIPSRAEQQRLFSLAHSRVVQKQAERQDWLQRATHWRALQLPVDGWEAARFIAWCLREGLFEAMGRMGAGAAPSDRHPDELSPEGVRLFWTRVAKLLTDGEPGR